MKKVYLILFALVVFALAMLFIRGEEDTWLCDKEKGEWVKHGVPSAPKPTKPCGQAKISPQIECTEEQRNVDACIEIYQPVCATVNIQCIKAPCDPIEETYANSCKACSNSLVSSYRNGECNSK